MKSFYVLNILWILSGSKLAKGDCSPSLFQLDSNSLLTLSDDVVDTTNAENQCNSLGGNLLDVKDQTIYDTLIGSLTKYTADLERIWKYRNNQKNIYSYATDLNEPNWEIPIDELQYIDLYQSSSSEGTNLQLLCFCTPGYEIRNIIKNDACPSGDWESIALTGYGGKKDSAKYRKVYSLEGNHGSLKWSAKLSLGTEGFQSRNILEIYEPVFYVYIGSHFDASNKKRTRSDEAEAYAATSELADCQQTVLHYEENWKLTDIACNTKAYFACQVKDLLSPFWNQLSCNGSIIEVGWKHNMDGLESLSGLKDITITVKVDDQQESQPTPLNSSPVTIENLIPQKSYSITVSAGLTGCQNMKIESSLSITTVDNRPESVTDAFVWSPYDCIVEVPHRAGSASNKKPTAYQITAESEVNKTTTKYGVSLEEMEKAMKLKIAVNDHGFEQRVNLSIKSISENCSAATELIQGYCISPAACSIVTAKAQDSVLVLSDDLGDVKTAEETCLLFGGYLVTTNDEKIGEALNNIMTRTYTRDLTRVWIFYNENNPRFTRYSTNSIQISPWISTGTLGQLEFVDLSNKIFPNVSKSVFFCRNNDMKWAVQKKFCNEGDGWTEDFVLYEGTNSSRIFREVYNYLDSSGWNPTYSSRLLSEDKEYGNYTVKQENVHAADMNVFIGARYDVNNEIWIWSDGTEANFDQPSQKTCKQKILHYGKLWQLADVNCDNYQALFACQTKLTVLPLPESCNSAFAQVKWEDNLSKLTKQTGHEIKMKIEISENTVKSSTYPDYEDLGATFSNLSPRTTYYVTVTAMFEGCNSFDISSTVNFTTGYGPPDSVSNPRVKQSNDLCIVSVDQNPSIEKYVVTANSSEASTEQVFNASDGLNLTISTNGHGNGNQIILTIYSTNCEGQSAPVAVDGVCSSPAGGSSPSSVGAIVGGVVGGLLVIGIIAAIFIYRRRIADKLESANHSSQRQDSDLARPPRGAATSHQQVVFSNPYGQPESRIDVSLEPTYQNAAAFMTSSSILAAYRTKCVDGGKVFKEEFEIIVKKSKSNQMLHAVAQHPSNAQRNRYKNIYPYDHARVVITTYGENDYINAAYMPGYTDKKKFIATQGPKHSTLSDFWLMTWQQGSNIIIMLTKLREVEKAKCEKYWPDLGKSKVYGSIKVQTIEESRFGGIVQRKFVLHQNMETFNVTQFQYVTWPDHGIPLTTSNMFYLRKMIEGVHEKGRPIIAHCSAGAGRTGTYIAMDFLFDQLDAEGTCDVIRCVSKMRENRTDMVQSWKQYALIYKLIVEHQTLPDTDRTTDELQALTEADMSKMMTQEFNLLSTPLPTAGNDTDDMLIKMWDEDSQSVIKMNASRIEGLVEGTSYISAQGPTSQTEAPFWMMALERHNGLIVCMESNGDHVANLVEHETIQMGRISIRVESSRDYGFAIEKELSYSGAVKGRRKFISFSDWNSTKLPSVAIMLNFVNIVQQLERECARGSALVYCSDGCSKSGTLITLMNILERVKTTNKADVFRTVKDLRDIRPNIVNNLNCYRFIYAVVMDYLNSFNTYSNYR